MIMRRIRQLALKATSIWMQRMPVERRLIFLFRFWKAVEQTMCTPTELWLMRKRVYDRYCGTWSVVPSESQARIYGFFHLISKIGDIPGDIVECGVGKGNSLATLVYAVSFFGLDKAVYGFDSFVGFPLASAYDLGARVKSLDTPPEGWADTSIDMVSGIFRADREGNQQSLLVNRPVAPILVQGNFSDTLPDNLPARIAFLHVDCDLYESTRTVLENCLPRVSTGGIIILDEYHDENWPGAKKAADEVCSHYDLTVQYFNELQRYGIQV